jgi:hypothetical protein
LKGQTKTNIESQAMVDRISLEQKKAFFTQYEHTTIAD